MFQVFDVPILPTPIVLAKTIYKYNMELSIGWDIEEITRAFGKQLTSRPRAQKKKQPQKHLHLQYQPQPPLRNPFLHGFKVFTPTSLLLNKSFSTFLSNKRHTWRKQKLCLKKSIGA
jgi:hypothetical protein